MFSPSLKTGQNTRHTHRHNDSCMMRLPGCFHLPSGENNVRNGEVSLGHLDLAVIVAHLKTATERTTALFAD